MEILKILLGLGTLFLGIFLAVDSAKRVMEDAETRKAWKYYTLYLSALIFQGVSGIITAVMGLMYLVFQMHTYF